MVNASGNKLTFFPIVELFQLRYLDLSNNELTTVPQNMWFIAPILEILVLDYNPIAMVKFGRTFLTQLSMSHMPRLTYLEANSFSQIGKIKFYNLNLNNKTYKYFRGHTSKYKEKT